MLRKTNKSNNNSKISNNENRKILFDIEKLDVEKSYNINSSQGTEAYFSNRYGWTLRRRSK